jgi:hypothetical protein
VSTQPKEYHSRVYLMFFLWIIYFSSLAFMFVASTAFAEGNDTVFQTAKKFDAVYENGISSSGLHKSVSPPLFRDQKQEQVTEDDWQYARSGRKGALLEVSRSVPKLDNDGYLLPHRQCILFDEKRSGKIMITLAPDVPLSSYQDSQDIKNASRDMHAPDSDILSLQSDMFQMALGRGVCNKIVEIAQDSDAKTIDRNGETCWILSGQGFYMSRKGTWEIHVLPEAAYMLRYAKFFSGDDIILEIETFGVNNHSDCVYPKKAEIRIPIGSKSITHFFTFSEAQLSYNSALFDQVEKDFNRELPDGSVVMDDISGKDKINVVGSETKHRPDAPRPRSAVSRNLIIGANLILIILLLYLLYRRNRLKKMA